MLLDALGSLTAGAKNQYIKTFLRGKALREIENLCFHIGNTTTMHLNKNPIGFR